MALSDEGGCYSVFLESDTVRVPGGSSGEGDSAHIPDILREQLVRSLEEAVAPIRAATEGLPPYARSGRPSVASVAGEEGAHLRLARARHLATLKAQERQQRRRSRPRLQLVPGSGHRSSSRDAPGAAYQKRTSVPEEVVVLEEEWFGAPQADGGSASSSSSSSSNSSSSSSSRISRSSSSSSSGGGSGDKSSGNNDGVDAAPRLSSPEEVAEEPLSLGEGRIDLDAPRFYFLYLWAELLLPYSGEPSVDEIQLGD